MTEREKPPSRLKPLALLFQDATGAVRFGRLERLNIVEQLPPGPGRPKKTLRDAAMLMHAEYLWSIGGLTKTKAISRVAEMFGLADSKRIWSTLKNVRDNIVKGFEASFSMADSPAPDGSPRAQVMAIFESAQAVTKVVDATGTQVVFDGTGYIVKWGDHEATFGRITGQGTSAES